MSSTPGTVRITIRTFQSCNVRRSMVDCLSDFKVYQSTWPSPEVLGPSVGSPYPAGILERASASFSPTKKRACWISVVSEKYTLTYDNPNNDTERISSMPLRPASELSTGKVMSFSTSSEARPGDSVYTFTCTGVTSGKASKGTSCHAFAPKKTTTTNARMTSSLYLRAASNIQFNMLFS